MTHPLDKLTSCQREAIEEGHATTFEPINHNPYAHTGEEGLRRSWHYGWLLKHRYERAADYLPRLLEE